MVKVRIHSSFNVAKSTIKMDAIFRRMMI